MQDRVIHLVFSTHWDREWYKPFQKFREKLVRVLDTVLEQLESGRLPFYQMDGQFIPVEDYLEIRPEKSALVRELIEAGRFRVGPWYNLPDSFLVSGESLVRNLQLGMKRAETWGGTSHVGWLCDIFGHNSQTPQILVQMGLDNAILWRGAPYRLGPFFRWASPDGSEVQVVRFPSFGYCDFNFGVRAQNERKSRLKLEQWLERANAYVEKCCKENAARNLLWFDGGDHLEFHPDMIEFVARFNHKVGRDMIKISTLDLYLQALASEALPSQPVFNGEMREPAVQETRGWLIPGVGSSRVPLKQANHAGETLLTLWAEPWCGAARLALGMEYPVTSLELAWNYLLENHPHDSICGCSTDETHNAMPYRFDQSRQIAEVYLDRALRHFGALAAKDLTKEEIGLSLFAPAGGAAQVCPEAYVRLPSDWPQFQEFFGFEKLPSFRIFDSSGQEVRYQLLAVDPKTSHLLEPPHHFPGEEFRQGVRFVLETTLAPGEQKHFVLRRETRATRISQVGKIGVARDTLQNQFLKVKAEDNGTLSLENFATGQRFSGLLAMEDSADIGDGWFHGIAAQDQAFLSTGGHVTYGLRENGPLLGVLHVRVEWLVPREFDFHVMRRSRELVPLVAEHIIKLRKDSPCVEVTTTVDNQVRDHRLRLLCPTGFRTATHFTADTPFDAVERPIAVLDGHLLRERPVEMTPQQNWIALAENNAGLALIAPGQYESAVLDQPDRPLCLTLLRGFRKAVFTDGNEGCQIIGRHSFPLALMPFAGSPEEPVPAASLQRTAQSLAAPCRSFYFDQDDIVETDVARLADARPVPEVRGDVVVTASFPAGPDEWTIRVYNPSKRPVPVKLIGGVEWRVTSLNGANAQLLAKTSFTVPGKKIVTFSVKSR